MPAMDAKEWQAEGLQLAQTHKRHQWKIADWILEGIALHTSATEAYDIAEQVFPEYSRTTFMEWASVARTFPPLVRTKDFPDLYFGHFKTALAVNSVPENAEETARLRMEWLKQAQDKKLSVAAFRLAIYDAFALAQPKPKPEQEPAPAAPAPRPAKTAGQRGLEYKLPLSAIEHQNLEKLALARGVSPAMLAKVILVEYLDAHSDEFVVAERQRAEADAVRAAAQAVWDLEKARRNEAWKKAEAYRQKRESITASLSPLWHHAKQNKSLFDTLVATRGWFIQNPNLPIEEMEARVNELLAAHLPDEAEAAMLAAANEPATPAQEPATPAEVVPPEGEIPFEQAAAASVGS